MTAGCRQKTYGALLTLFVVCVHLAACQDVCGISGNVPAGLKSYPFSSSYVQIFDWMRIPCNGKATAVTFASIGWSNVTLRFYLGVFQPVKISSGSYYKLINYAPVDVPSVKDGTTARTVMLADGALTVSQQNVFGVFYDRWNFPQSQMVVPYQAIFNGTASKYPTYVGPAGLPDLLLINRLRIGAELSSFPYGRMAALAVTIVAGETTTTPQPAGVPTSRPRFLSSTNSCGNQPPSVPNGYVTFQSFGETSYVGDVIEYSCLLGYRLKIGTYYRVTCQEPLIQWSELPECIVDNRTSTSTTTTTTEPPTTPPRPIVICPKTPGNLFNGFEYQRDFDEEAQPGNSILYRCNGGYFLSGINGEEVHCRADGTWSPMPVCLEKKTPCETVPKVKNAVLYNQTHFLGQLPVDGDVLVFLCKQGYHSNYDDYWRVTLRCRNATWTIKQPECVPDYVPQPLNRVFEEYSCGDPPKISTAFEMKRSWSGLDYSMPGDFVTYTCRDGYGMLGNGKAKCLGDLSWNVEFECKSKIAPLNRTSLDCGLPLHLDNAFEVSRRFIDSSSPIGFIGDSVTYKCNSGFVMVGSASVFCQADNAWAVRFFCVDRRSKR